VPRVSQARVTSGLRASRRRRVRKAVAGRCFAPAGHAVATSAIGGAAASALHAAVRIRQRSSWRAVPSRRASVARVAGDRLALRSRAIAALALRAGAARQSVHRVAGLQRAMSAHAIFVAGAAIGRAPERAPRGTAATHDADVPYSASRVSVAFVNRHGASALIRGGSGLTARAEDLRHQVLTIRHSAALRCCRARRVQHCSGTGVRSSAARSLIASGAAALFVRARRSAASRRAATAPSRTATAAVRSPCTSARRGSCASAGARAACGFSVRCGAARHE